MQEINDDMKITEDYLQSLLLSCLAHRIRLIIGDKQKSVHWCLQWAGKNMTHMAVNMLLMDHVKYDLFFPQTCKTIMKKRESFVKTNDERQT